MKRVLICNARIQESADGEIITSEAFDVTDFLAPDTSGDTVYVIDVHFSFMYGEQENKRQLKAQEQGGVTVYRHLLELFKSCPDKLKVVFYSPLTANRLTALRPENHVLNLLPFVELFPKDKQGNLIEDWTFEGALQSRIDENDFPQFNNASENLLSGWALGGATKIDLQGNQPLIIDDDWRQWKVTYDAMLSGSVDYFLKDKVDIKEEFGKLDDGTFPHLPDGSLDRYDFIISDLYLTEAHETTLWKTEYVINSISGFKLFRRIRKIEPAIPVLFHTTSTKFRVFETLSALGADGQIAKNNSPNSARNEKVETALLLKQSLESLLSPYSECWLNSFYRFLSNEGAVSNKWWAKLRKVANNPSLKKEVIDIVRSIILNVKTIKRIKPGYFEIFFPEAEVKPISLVVSGVIANAGKLFEPALLSAGYNPELQFLYQLRNHTAHGSSYHTFNFDDVLVVIGLLEKTLKESKSRMIGRGESFKTPFKNAEKYTHPLFEYLHYYNTWGYYIPNDLTETFKARIDALLDDYQVNCWNSYSNEVREGIIAEMDYMEVGDKVKPVFSNAKCRILLTNSA